MSVDPRYPNVTMYTEQEARDRLAAELVRVRERGLTERELWRRSCVVWTATAEEYALWDAVMSWRYLLGKSGWDQPLMDEIGP